MVVVKLRWLDEVALSQKSCSNVFNLYGLVQLQHCKVLNLVRNLCPKSHVTGHMETVCTFGFMPKKTYWISFKVTRKTLQMRFFVFHFKDIYYSQWIQVCLMTTSILVVPPDFCALHGINIFLYSFRGNDPKADEDGWNSETHTQRETDSSFIFSGRLQFGWHLVNCRWPLKKC